MAGFAPFELPPSLGGGAGAGAAAATGAAVGGTTGSDALDAVGVGVNVGVGASADAGAADAGAADGDNASEGAAPPAAVARENPILTGRGVVSTRRKNCSLLACSSDVPPNHRMASPRATPSLAACDPSAMRST